MTTEQRKALTERLAEIQQKERELWKDYNEKKAESNATANQWVLASNELDFLKKLVALPENPAITQ